MKKLIVVVGATASGKTNFSIQVAKAINSQIVSCDSMQIYKHMDIGTAKVDNQEMQNIPHKMIDILMPNKDFSVGEYRDLAQPIINNMHKSNIIPVVVGGTGLYIDGLIYPMTFSANKDDDVRKRLYNELDMLGCEYMHKKLQEIDPLEAQKIHCNNTKRLIRALEIYELTGQIKSNMTDKKKPLNYDILMFFLNPPRDILYERINNRVDKMLELGLENEVKSLLSQEYSWDCQGMQGIGYKEFKNYFDGISDLETTKNLIKQNTRHYAKRQITWFKRYDFAKEINTLDNNQINEALSLAIEFCKP